MRRNAPRVCAASMLKKSVWPAFAGLRLAGAKRRDSLSGRRGARQVGASCFLRRLTATTWVCHESIRGPLQHPRRSGPENRQYEERALTRVLKSQQFLKLRNLSPPRWQEAIRPPNPGGTREAPGCPWWGFWATSRVEKHWKRSWAARGLPFSMSSKSEGGI
jgi:hypothetical protein